MNKCYEAVRTPGAPDLRTVFGGLNGVRVEPLPEREAPFSTGGESANIHIEDEALAAAQARAEKHGCPLRLRVGSMPML